MIRTDGTTAPLTRPDGTPIQVGLIRRRPTQPWSHGESAGFRVLEVWLQLTPDDLTALVRARGAHRNDPAPRQLVVDDDLGALEAAAKTPADHSRYKANFKTVSQK